MDVLRVKGLSQSYGGLQVLNNLSFSLETGEKVALIGPNGAGKNHASERFERVRPSLFRPDTFA